MCDYGLKIAAFPLAIQFAKALSLEQKEKWLYGIVFADVGRCQDARLQWVAAKGFRSPSEGNREGF